MFGGVFINNMNRIDGFIDISQMLQEIGVDTTNLKSILESHFIDRICGCRYHFSFDYKCDKYFFKIRDYDNNNLYDTYSVYNELIVEELARDYGIPCIDYDLAVLGSYQGVLSKNYKLENANYIYGYDLLNDYEKSTGHSGSNTLPNIWRALEYRYQNNFNKREIISNLMKKIVDIYLFDVITCQSDRHSSNWQIVENDDNIDVAPLYDNECILKRQLALATVALSMRGGDQLLLESIKQFQNVSSEEYRNIIKEKIWIISDSNLKTVFERVENKIGCALPDRYKDYLSGDYEAHRDKLEKILSLNNEVTKH